MKTKKCKCGETRPGKFYEKCNLCKECTKVLRKREYNNRPRIQPMTEQEMEQASYIDRKRLRAGFLAAFSNCHVDGIRC